MLVSKTRVKKMRKIKNAMAWCNMDLQRERFFYVILCLGKNGSLLYFPCFFQAFFMRFSRVSAHKPSQSANPTHGVIWA